jgi:integrase
MNDPSRVFVSGPFAAFSEGFLHSLLDLGIDPATEVPPAALLPWQRCRATPYLYSDGEVAALVTAATSLQTPYRVLTYQTLIGLLAVTGMRVGEALALDRDDIDMPHAVLTVRLTKFGKSRELPVPASTVEALGRYLGHRDRPRAAVSIAQRSFRPQELGCCTPTCCGHFNGFYAVPESRGDRQRAVPGSMIFVIDSQSKPCLTPTARTKMQKQGLRFYA